MPIPKYASTTVEALAAQGHDRDVARAAIRLLRDRVRGAPTQRAIDQAVRFVEEKLRQPIRLQVPVEALNLKAFSYWWIFRVNGRFYFAARLDKQLFKADISKDLFTKLANRTKRGEKRREKLSNA